jgi:regulator of protease activity HflC (stomatin/prohibitin superfamily)
VYIVLGFRYLKAAPTTHVMRYSSGALRRQGAGLTGWYFAPTAEIVQVPLSSIDVPFVFNESTGDFQEATIQGELTYRITDPQRLAASLDYSVDHRGRYRSEDPTKLNERLIHAAQVSARSFTQKLPLRSVLVGSDSLIADVLGGLRDAEAVLMLGIEILGLSILSIRANPEMSKALQAEAREELLRKADEAVYVRRNAAVLQERTIKENELNTEIAVEQKKRQKREAQMAAEIAVEEQRTVLVDHRVGNEKKEAESRAQALAQILEPLKGVDWRTLLAANGGGDARLNIALAFRQLAESAEKIGVVNISPDLLDSLTRNGSKE